MKENTDFVIFGTFLNHEADILKQEFDKVNIPVKILYPGTPLGKESYGGANWTSYTLLIRECDIEKANTMKEGLGIEIAETIPFIPTSRSIGNLGIVKLFASAGVIFFLATLILGFLQAKDIILVGCIIISILCFLIVSLLSLIPKKQKYEQSNEEDDINRG